MSDHANNFRSADFLRGHIQSILAFYEANVVDTSGGFHQNYYDNGELFQPGLKHLVSSTRMVFNYCKAYELFGNADDLARAKHGLAYVREVHFDAEREAYNWLLQDHQAADQANMCYGMAFVILAFSAAHEAGIDGAKDDLYAAFQIMEKRFWQPEEGIYADEYSADWSTLDDYRGQNANMHACEAMLAAYEATQDVQFLDRAEQLADKFAVEMADKANGLIWEHYRTDQSIDWDYNKDDPKNLYKPWGFQPGHQTEWTKLLLILNSHRPLAWAVERAQALFDKAMAVSWDEQHGGIYYGFDPEGAICDDDKYFWVQAETFAAAARLAQVTGDEKYWQWYDRIWQYAQQHMIDPEFGAWYRVLRRNNEKYSNEKSCAGGKCDYHTMGACWDVLRVLGA